MLACMMSEDLCLGLSEMVDLSLVILYQPYVSCVAVRVLCDSILYFGNAIFLAKFFQLISFTSFTSPSRRDSRTRQAGTRDGHARRLLVVLLKWVWNLYGRSSILDAVDPRLRGDDDEEEHSELWQMERVLVVGLWCAYPDRSERPSIAPTT